MPPERNPADPAGHGPGAGAGTGAPVAGQADWQVPWPDTMRSASWTPERTRLALAFAAAVRKTGSLFHLMSQAAADKIGINATDLNCLNILSFGGQLTAGDLARAAGLTTASITGVVDRLEQAGFVHRERDSQDRRRVVVTLDIGRARDTVMPVFGPMMGAWQRMADRYTDDELRLILEYYGRIEQILRDHLARLRQSAP